MKVLYINGKLNSSGGGSVHGRKIVEKLRSLGVSLLTMPNIKDEKTIKFSNNIFKSLMLNIPSVLKEFIIFIKTNLMYLLRLKKIYHTIKIYNPDCIIIRSELYDLTPIVVKKISKIPIILESNQSFYLERKLYYETQKKKPIIPRFLFNLDIKIWKSADAIYVVSNTLKKIIKSQFGNKTSFIKVIPNGVDINYFDKLHTEYLKIQSDFIKIGFVGSLQFWHGVDLLLDVYEMVTKLRPMTRLIIIGDGESRKNLENYVRFSKNLNGNVIFTGRLTHEETIKKLLEMDILAAPYRISSFFCFSPLKIFEYMASGKAIIATGLGQISEILEDGVDSILINPEDKAEFCNALLTLIDSEEKRNKLGKMAFHKVRNYTWEKSAKSLLNLVKKIVNKKMCYG